MRELKHYEFKSMYEDLEPKQKKWVQLKASKENLSSWYVMEKYPIPPPDHLAEDGTWKVGEKI